MEHVRSPDDASADHGDEGQEPTGSTSTVTTEPSLLWERLSTFHRTVGTPNSPTCWCRPISRGLILTHFNSLGWVDRLTTQPNNQKPPKLPWIGFCRAQSLSLNDNTHARPQTHTEGLTTNQKTTDCRVRAEKLWYWSYYFTWDYLVMSFRKSGRFENMSSWKGPWEWANSPPPKNRGLCLEIKVAITELESWLHFAAV